MEHSGKKHKKVEEMKNSSSLGSDVSDGSKLIFMQWRFWVVVVIVVVVSAGFSWWVNMQAVKGITAENLDRITKRAYVEYQERRSEYLEATYRADNVGGETPEVPSSSIIFEHSEENFG